MYNLVWYDEDIPISNILTRQASQQAADSNRDILNANKVINGDKMISKHDHKRNKVTREFKVGAMVTVRIPRIDRAGTDFKRMPGIVGAVRTHGDNLHHDWYRTGDLEP